jgi:hypothetical protein
MHYPRRAGLIDGLLILLALGALLLRSLMLR